MTGFARRPIDSPGARRAAALFALLIGLAFAPQLPAEENLSAKQAELERLRGRIQSLQRELESDRGRQSEVERELAESERAISRLVRAVAELDGRMAEQAQRLDGLKRERDAQRRHLAGQRDELARQIRAAHALGRQERLKLLLNQQEPAAVGRLMVYYDYFHRARAQRIEAIGTSLRRLDELEVEIGRETSRLAELKGEREREQAELRDGQAKRRTLLARLESRIRDRDAELERLRGDEKRLTGLIEQLRQAMAALSHEAAKGKGVPFGKQRGKLGWPTRGRLAARFGASRGLGDLTWQGLLIKAREGRGVKAVAAGRVAFSDWLRGYGMLTIIDHGDGYMSLYGYNRSLYRQVGDWVEAGDLIAQVGDTGGRKEHALYFEIRRQGRPVNPLAWLKRG